MPKVTDVGWIVTYQGQSGGNWVRETVESGLADRYTFSNVDIDSGLGVRQFPQAVWQLATHSDPAIDIWIETIGSLALRLPDRRRPHILALHHLAQPSPFESLAGAVTALKNRIAIRRMSRADRIVVVSDFWASFLADLGIERNVRTVYNGLPIERFDLDADAVARTRERLLEDGEGPLIHVGPCAPGKGGTRVFHRLKDWDATLITTGRKVEATPVTHVNPPYEEYLRVLAACDVVIAMSESLEGWNLQVQEAMLCRTPVVGSGSGGMRMLLEGGGQVICDDVANLQTCVGRALSENEMGERGHQYARQFTRDRMLEGWATVLAEVT